jgi:hypothetical protein
MPKPIAGKTALTRIQRLNTGTIQTLETNVQKSPNIKKAVLRRTESKIQKQIEKLRADIERDSERLKSCHHLDERSCEDRLHEDVAKHTAMYDALKIVSDMVTELEWLSNWKD